MSENMIACNLTFEEINKLADKVENGKLSKVKIKNGDCEIVIEKEIKGPPVMPMIPPPSMGMAVGTSPASPSVSQEQPEAEKEISGNIVKAPIVGTYYSKPGPDKASFVEGKTVKKGDVLMIIESMKLMNEVQSEFDGVVKEILVSDGAAVEYDQPIMIIG